MRYDSIEHLIHDDAFLRLRNFAHERDVYVKIEGFNPGGSIKMKTALSLIGDAERNRHLATRRRIIESSSGNLGLSLAIIASARGYHFTCVVDLNTSAQNIEMMRALGANVIVIEQRDAQGGYLANRLAYIQAAVERDSDLIWLNQYQNPANPAIHAATTACSILREFGQVDYLFIGTGTAGTLMGCVDFFRCHSPQTTLVAVDAIGSVTFGTPAQTRYLPGLGASVMPHFFESWRVDKLMQASEADAIANCRDVATRYGYMSGASTGTTLAAVRRMLKEIPREATVVAISPDLGQGYLDTVYNDDWCTRTFGEAWRHISVPCKKELVSA